MRFRVSATLTPFGAELPTSYKIFGGTGEFEHVCEARPSRTASAFRPISDQRVALGGR
jgi:hypothetical protein